MIKMLSYCCTLVGWCYRRSLNGLGFRAFGHTFSDASTLFFPTNLIDYKSFLSSQNWNVNVDGNNFDLGRDVINDIASH